MASVEEPTKAEASPAGAKVRTSLSSRKLELFYSVSSPLGEETAASFTFR